MILLAIFLYIGDSSNSLKASGKKCIYPYSWQKRLVGGNLHKKLKL